ncbi:hypothetical protein [Nocardioides albus]|uniref:Uncharacterized protein n=1 Tax=Nocardioides albus TaxID=1841 RepID=A0A7W5A2Z0_9ACTN|nr:hypothetical protein [Nocardioides albus]MBB3088430.1 hypothetical protein [Nocardioides albus]GGU16260.1 hypothetical protein GCM10007979_13180 [Nocardioides albus]
MLLLIRLTTALRCAAEPVGLLKNGPAGGDQGAAVAGVETTDIVAMTNAATQPATAEAIEILRVVFDLSKLTHMAPDYTQRCISQATIRRT